MTITITIHKRKGNPVNLNSITITISFHFQLQKQPKDGVGDKCDSVIDGDKKKNEEDNCRDKKNEVMMMAMI